MIRPIFYEDDAVVVLDQALLPDREVYVKCRTVEDAARAITSMQVRGAPLIGVTAAYGMALAARGCRGGEAEFLACYDKAGRLLASTRPTAVNLFWGIESMKRFAATVSSLPYEERNAALLDEARRIHAEDTAMCRAMGRHGAGLLADGETVMTHCNAGALATAGYGSALGVFRAAREAGLSVNIVARETRPLLQGSKLTAWELITDGFEVTVIPDNAGAHMMKRGLIDRVITGADRIAANGDTANKIGTYDLAIIARHHGIPFHIVAPYSTIDFSLPDGSGIPIEERDADEIRRMGDIPLTPATARVYNPAFDVTPAELITSIINEEGVATAPYTESLKRLCGDKP